MPALKSQRDLQPPRILETREAALCFSMTSVLPHIILDNVPRPLGGEGGPQPAVSSAGAGRVRGGLPTDTKGINQVFCECSVQIWPLASRTDRAFADRKVGAT